MNMNKKDLEIVYNLQWKNGLGHGDDKANIVGMYDIPATTLSWESFKSYLLKNSGVAGDDVKVSYVSLDDKEFPIESQLDFQIALYSFRQRARNGDIITLKLDRISDFNSKMASAKRFRRSADTYAEEAKADSENSTVTIQKMSSECPPEWFKKYMKGFKKEIIEEVTASVLNAVANNKTQNFLQSPPYPHTRKSKMDCRKRLQKGPLLNEGNDGKDILKSLKMERKLDCKLEKLEQKTQKIKEKKLALTRSGGDNDIGRKSRPIGVPLSDTEFRMDASAIGQYETKVPHMLGGETYQQTWKVINTGEMPWTSSTELRYAWGSEALRPIETIVPCPELNPGEKGIVMVYLEIPTNPGPYECYWHFYHEGRRFGHWLGCHFIVDPLRVRTPPPVFTGLSENKLLLGDDSLAPNKLKMFEYTLLSNPEQFNKPLNTSTDLKSPINEKDVQDVSGDLQNLKLDETIDILHINNSSDSDNRSIVSIAGSDSSLNSAQSDEFVLVPMTLRDSIPNEPDAIENVTEPICTNIKLEENNSENKNDDGNNNNEIKQNTELSTEQATNTTDPELNYAYVMFEGQKIAVPKSLLRSDYLVTAEEAPAPLDLTKTEHKEETSVTSIKKEFERSPNNGSMEQKETASAPVDVPKMTQSMYASAECSPKSSRYSMSNSVHSESMSCSNKSRLFVFPLNCPGFEVVYPSPSCANDNLSMSECGPNESCNGTCMTNSIYSNNENLLENSTSTYNWAQSGSGYVYNSPNVHDQICHMTNMEHATPRPSHGGSTPSNDKGNRSTLHHRFGNYMRYASPPLNPGTANWVPFHYPQTFANHPCSAPQQQAQNEHSEFCDRRSSTVHTFPDAFVSGAVNVASSAINTARSVLNMFSPPPLPKQEQTSPQRQEPENLTAHDKALRTLWEMGFWDIDLNGRLLNRFNNDVARVVSELIQ